MNQKIQLILDPNFGVRCWNDSKLALKNKIITLKLKQLKTKQKGWNLEQNKKYVSFLQKHQQTIENLDRHKKYKIFDKMALSINTRSSVQCKSHHQKMMRRFKSIQLITDYFSKKIQQNTFIQQKQKVISQNSSFQQSNLFCQNVNKRKNCSNKSTLYSQEFNNNQQKPISHENISKNTSSDTENIFQVLQLS